MMAAAQAQPKASDCRGGVVGAECEVPIDVTMEVNQATMEKYRHAHPCEELRVAARHNTKLATARRSGEEVMVVALAQPEAGDCRGRVVETGCR